MLCFWNDDAGWRVPSKSEEPWMFSRLTKFVGALKLIVGLGAIAVSSSAAYADCLSRCLGTCANSISEPYCKEVKNRCYAQCSNAGTHDYGAIAYSSSTEAYGWSNKRDTQEEAENAALEQCGKRASDCEIEVWFDQKCGAVAAGGNWVGSGWGDTQRQAESEALKVCRQGGDDTCAVKASACSRGDAD